MKSIRVLTMTILLATATAVSAQTPPAQPTPFYPSATPQDYPPALPYTPGQLQALEAAQAQFEAGQATECPFAKALQEANVAWQRLRALCGAVKMGGCGQSNACKGDGCATDRAGCAKGSEAQPKSCSCAKACGCCETCKAAKTQETTQLPQVLPNPMPCPMGEMPFACPYGSPVYGAPAPMPCPGSMMPPGTAPSYGSPLVAGRVQIVVPPMPPTPIGPQVVFMPVNRGAKPAKLVTPDFEAHCDQMMQRGDTIQLVGNVMLLCKKYAQPLRVEGERIVINLKDGSFVVEAGPALPRMSAPAVGFGVMRMSVGECPLVRPVANTCAPPTMPMGSCITPQERVAHRIRLRNAQAVDVAKAITDYIGKVNCIYYSGATTRLMNTVEATVVAEPITNSVMIETTPENLEKLLKIFSKLDMDAPSTPPCLPTSECPPRTIAPAAGVIEVVPVAPAPVTSPRPR